MTKYHEWTTDEGLARLASYSAAGLDISQIAQTIGVSEKTLGEWIERFPLIRSAVYGGEEYENKQVEKALLKRALGYSHSEVTRQLNKEGDMEVVKIVEKEVMPSTTAQIFWLKNRCGYIWDGTADESDEEEGGLIVLPPAKVSDDE